MVDEDYEVQNGLIGMRYIVLMRLCDVLGERPENVRVVIGCCLEHVQWLTRKENYFAEMRVMYIRPTLDTGRLERTQSGMRYNFVLPDQWERVSLSLNPHTVISQGVWRWTVQIRYSNSTYPEPSCFCVGPTRIKDSYSYYENTVYFKFEKHGRALKTYVCGTEDVQETVLRRTRIPNDAFVSVEIDNERHTLSLLVDGRRVPHLISDLPPSEGLWIKGCNAGAFTSVSLHHLRSAYTLPSSYIIHPATKTSH